MQEFNQRGQIKMGSTLFYSYVGAGWADDRDNMIFAWYYQLVHPWIDLYHSIQVSPTIFLSHPRVINFEMLQHNNIHVDRESYADTYVGSPNCIVTGFDCLYHHHLLILH